MIVEFWFHDKKCYIYGSVLGIKSGYHWISAKYLSEHPEYSIDVHDSFDVCNFMNATEEEAFFVGDQIFIKCSDRSLMIVNHIRDPDQIKKIKASLHTKS